MFRKKANLVSSLTGSTLVLLLQSTLPPVQAEEGGRYILSRLNTKPVHVGPRDNYIHVPRGLCVNWSRISAYMRGERSSAIPQSITLKPPEYQIARIWIALGKNSEPSIHFFGVLKDGKSSLDISNLSIKQAQSIWGRSYRLFQKNSNKRAYRVKAYILERGYEDCILEASFYGDKLTKFRICCPSVKTEWINVEPRELSRKVQDTKNLLRRSIEFKSSSKIDQKNMLLVLDDLNRIPEKIFEPLEIARRAHKAYFGYKNTFDKLYLSLPLSMGDYSSRSFEELLKWRSSLRSRYITIVGSYSTNEHISFANDLVYLSSLETIEQVANNLGYSYSHSKSPRSGRFFYYSPNQFYGRFSTTLCSRVSFREQ